jgi:5,5'-dehydrodivanillate O-demethylase oxygenase subunit
VTATQPRTEHTYAEADYTDFTHTGPGTLAGRYLRCFWQPVYRVEDLLPGHAKPIRVMSEDFTLYRGESGEPHLVDFRCAHRGTQLSTGWVEGDCLRCFYHGWKYDHIGQCVEMPAEEASFPPKVRIRSYPVQEYLGLIFAYLGEGEPPALPRFPALEEPGVLEADRFPRLCNYFNELENGADEVHVHFVHGEQAGHTVLRDLPEITAEESEYGILRYGKRADGKVRVSHNLMPNMVTVLIPPPPDLAGLGGWRDALLMWVPIDDATHYTYIMRLIRVTGADADEYRAREAERLERRAKLAPAHEVGQDVLAGRVRVQDLRHPDIVRIQDDVAQCGQGVFADRAHERLGRSDTALILWRRLWEREMRALAAGRPLKQWRVPPDIQARPGF